jgi:DNA polymerase-3 subunit beta
MFELTSSKQDLITPLLTVAGAVDKKQSTPILSNILMKLVDNRLYLTATDLEIEMTASIPCVSYEKAGAVTVPAKKIVDIIRSLDDDAQPTITCRDETLMIKVGRSQFRLATLSADDYPVHHDEMSQVELTIPRLDLLRLFQSTHFALTQHDVRFFLNGLLLELDGQTLSVVATDGHRMAIAKCMMQQSLSHQRLLIPRKAVQELLRLLNHIEDEQVVISAGTNHFKFVSQQYTFVSKLIEARFPVYSKVIPKNQDKFVTIDRDLLKRALARIMILANEKLRAITLLIQPSQLTLIAHNQQKEEAMEEIMAQTEGDPLEISINASYLFDVLNYIEGESVRLSFADINQSILVESVVDPSYQYIIMPMKR